MIDQLKTGLRYNLSMYAPSILGSNLTGALLKYSSMYEGVIPKNVDTIQGQVIGYLPDGTPRDHTRYIYYIFEQKGKEIVLADYWIVPGTIEVASGENYNIELINVTSTQVAAIRDQLLNLQIDFKIT